MLTRPLSLAAAVVAGLLSSGCNSPYHADRGALFGGLGGAGVGALVGNAVGNTAAGAIVGAGVGAISGAAVGGAIDDVEARNRAEIEARLGRPVAAGAVTIPEVLSMTRGGVDQDLIVNHIRAHGSAQALGSQDLIALQQEGVSKKVIQAMQTTPPVVVQAAAPAPVIVEEHYYDPWGWPSYPHGRVYYHPHRYRPPPRVGWGVSFGSGSRW